MIKFEIANKFARNTVMRNATTIGVTEHRNGSGPEAFGGAKKWPVIDIQISLPEGENGLAVDLAVKLTEIIRQELDTKGLLRHDTEQN